MSHAQNLDTYSDHDEPEDWTLVEIIQTSDGTEVRDAQDGVVYACLPLLVDIERWCEKNNCYFVPDEPTEHEFNPHDANSLPF